MSSQAARAAAFTRTLSLRAAERTEECAVGTAVFNDRLPLVWDLNALWVDRGDADLVADEAERLGRLKLLVPDERFGEALAPALAERGWHAEPLLVMPHGREPDRPADVSLVQEVDEPTIRRFSAISLERSALSDDARRQILEMKNTLAGATDVRFFAASVNGETASVCDLYSGGDTAQIEAVMTHEEHRGRGLARAVVLAALTAARESGNDLVFLHAEETDWPKELYRKLGFDVVDRTFTFVRRG